MHAAPGVTAAFAWHIYQKRHLHNAKIAVVVTYMCIYVYTRVVETNIDANLKWRVDVEWSVLHPTDPPMLTRGPVSKRQYFGYCTFIV